MTRIQQVATAPAAPAGLTRWGTGAPSAGLGNVGDYYVDESTGKVYGPKVSTATAAYTWGAAASSQPPSGWTSTPTMNSSGQVTLSNGTTLTYADASGHATVTVPTGSGGTDPTWVMYEALPSGWTSVTLHMNYASGADIFAGLALLGDSGASGPFVTFDLSSSGGLTYEGIKWNSAGAYASKPIANTAAPVSQGTPIWLRIDNTGTCYTSTDGTTFASVGSLGSVASMTKFGIAVDQWNATNATGTAYFYDVVAATATIAWPLFASAPQPAGLTRYGTGAPGLGVGNVGDYYVDEVTGNLYGPKTALSVPPPAFESHGDNGQTATNDSGVGSGTFVVTTTGSNALIVFTTGAWNGTTPPSLSVDGQALTAKTSNTAGSEKVYFFDVVVATPGAHTVAWNTGGVYGIDPVLYAVFDGYTNVGATYAAGGTGFSNTATGLVVSYTQSNSGSAPTPPTVNGSSMTSMFSGGVGSENWIEFQYVMSAPVGSTVSVSGDVTLAAYYPITPPPSSPWPLTGPFPGLQTGSGTTKWIASKTSAYTAAAGDAVPCDTTGGAFAVTLSSGLANGAPVRVKWKAGTAAPTIAAANGVTIDTTWAGFSNVGDIVDFSFNSITNVWEVV